MSEVKPIAFYLPQYHPISENDKWWGKGFTEWRNVVKARPRFKGHYQPHLPADLGFYDLRLPEVREAQAEMAKSHGIHGFCYYHYWFNGQRLLERPFNEVLATGQPDFPFCLCWANENWTRRWDGKEENILMEQVYNAKADRQHIQWLVKAFSDPRYIKIDGKPLFLVYRASSLPNPRQTTTIWREEAYKLGIGELFLARVESFGNEHNNPLKMGFDAAVEFQPDWTRLGLPLQFGRRWNWMRKMGLAEKAFGENSVYLYQNIVHQMLKKPAPNYLRFPCVTPSWDNTARRTSGATILHDSTPELYGEWLQVAIQKVIEKPRTHGFLFINAWNEWAEGNHLEPCQRWGREYLEKTKSIIDIYINKRKFSN
jgi:lipopolysaccharide biosynthesis protein